jgi:N-acetylmuramoyl-L-alanine amidase
LVKIHKGINPKEGDFLKKVISTIDKNKKSIVCISLALLIFILYNMFSTNIVQALSKYGSTGDEVRQIQTKLKRWGYYTGNIDGIYGSQTLEAVKYFQRKNGLVVDGIAGKNTLEAMGIYTSSSSSSSSSSSASSSDLTLLAKLVYGEARGEPYAGQVAVAAVVLNRVKSSDFPNTISGVIYQKGAFDVVSDGQINLTPNTTAKQAAQDALNGWDPSYGSIYYFNPSTATNKWIWSRPHVITIGKHRFCK